jgi:hypothetical protein
MARLTMVDVSAWIKYSSNFNSGAVWWDGCHVHASVLSSPPRPDGQLPKLSDIGLNLGLRPASPADSETGTAGERSSGAGEICSPRL